MLFMIVGAVAVIRGLFSILPAMSLYFAEPSDAQAAARLIMDGVPWLLGGLVILICTAILKHGKKKKDPDN